MAHIGRMAPSSRMQAEDRHYRIQKTGRLEAMTSCLNGASSVDVGRISFKTFRPVQRRHNTAISHAQGQSFILIPRPQLRAAQKFNLRDESIELTQTVLVLSEASQ